MWCKYIKKEPAVDCLASSRWMRGASRMGFDSEDNQLRFLTVILYAAVLTNWRAADMSASNGASAHRPASRDVHRPESAAGALYTANAPRPRASKEELGACEARLQVLVWVHVFMNTYMWVCVYDSKLIVKHAYILLLIHTLCLSVCLSFSLCLLPPPPLHTHTHAHTHTHTHTHILCMYIHIYVYMGIYILYIHLHPSICIL